MGIDTSKDPLGTAINDFYKNNKSDHLWVYSDISEKDEIPVPYLFRSFDAMPDLEQEALQQCKGKILDIGSAAGSHALWLQKQNFNVTALEISKLAVTVMENRGVKQIICSDFYEYAPSSVKYDTLLLLMNGIGIAGTISGLKAFFEQCKKILKAKGQIILDSSDLVYLFNEDEEKPIDKYYGEVRYVMNYKDIISDPFEWLFIDFETLKNEASKYGFNCRKLIDGEHYDYLAKLTLL